MIDYIIAKRSMTASEFMLFSLIVNRMQPDGTDAYVDTEGLAAQMNITRRGVQKTIKGLSDKRFLVVKPFKRHMTCYDLGSELRFLIKKK